MCLVLQRAGSVAVGWLSCAAARLHLCAVLHRAGAVAVGACVVLQRACADGGVCVAARLHMLVFMLKWACTDGACVCASARPALLLSVGACVCAGARLR